MARATGVELPGETRGLLRPEKKWGSSSIGSIAIGQEVGVTPLQLVSMVSTIANGGTYLPPHVLMPAEAPNGPHGETKLQPEPFKPGGELPNPLPPGAHRVVSEMTAAQMRKMMEGVVLYGTGKPAQLNGYSSGGKTGTAQKIDPATHLYSKTMHIASFAGFAPVNNPVISVAVVIDDPRGGSYYGTAVSAPVFAEVAQQVLEYLGVSHDIDVLPPKVVAAKKAPATEDDAERPAADIEALYSAANDLPNDDPLRDAANQNRAGKATPAQTTAKLARSTAPSKTVKGVSQVALGRSQRCYTHLDLGAPGPSQLETGDCTRAGYTNTENALVSQPPTPSQSGSEHQKSPAASSVVVSDGGKLQVPSLIGLPVRRVIELAAEAGLQVQITGNGTAREQAPNPGTMVARGTQIVVRCGQ